MKKVLYNVALVCFFMGASVLTSVAASAYESHHPSGAQAAVTSSSQGMMMQPGSGMNQMPCMTAPFSGAEPQMMGGRQMGMMGGRQMGMMGGGQMGMMGGGQMGMMGGGQMGMMEQGMGHLFYLDRADELGLSAEQLNKLKAIHVEGRKDNIRNAAETKIAWLELSELLATDNWMLNDAESLVRKVQTLEGDSRIRTLQALSDARKVLTAEQLQQVQAGGGGNPENLFQ